jgi:hypothetical protein
MYRFIWQQSAENTSCRRVLFPVLCLDLLAPCELTTSLTKLTAPARMNPELENQQIGEVVQSIKNFLSGDKIRDYTNT